MPFGTVLGILAGIGAFAIPPAIGLDENPTGRSGMTRALTVCFYALGGLAAGLTVVVMDDSA